MAKRGWWVGGVAAVLALAGLFAWRMWILPIHVAAPEPAVTADSADTLLQVPVSVLTAPIAFELRPAIAQFEIDVPRSFGSMDQRIRADSSARTSVAFAASRSPFQVHVRGTDLVIETVLEYEGRGWYNPPLGPEVSAGCGGGDDPKPRLRLRIVSTPSLTPEWGLRASTRVYVDRFSDEPRDQCRVSLLKIDVTDNVARAVGQELARRVGRLDRHIARLDTRSRMERIWKKMERPIRLADGIWLLIQPRAAQLASFSGAGDTLVAVVRLEAQPKIVSGVRPEESTLVNPLPPLGMTADTVTGLYAILEGTFSYDAATRLMQKPLVGKVIRMAGRRVRIEGLTLRGIGSGRVALGVNLSGAVQGRIFLTGTPQLDLVTRQVKVPDLDFDVGSADLMAHGLTWWKGDAVRDFLRAQAAIPDTAALAGVERKAQLGMNRELTAGVNLEVALSSSRGLAVRATRERLILRALAEGSARLVVDRVLVRAGRRSSAHP